MRLRSRSDEVDNPSMALLRPQPGAAEPVAPAQPPVPPPASEVADLVGWTVAASVRGAEDTLDVVVRDAWDRPSGASGAPCALSVVPPEDAVELVDAGTPVDLSWPAIGGRQQLATTVTEIAGEVWELHAGWPPSRVQERRYLRVEARVRTWLTRLEPEPVTALTCTVDVGGGGVAVERLPHLGLQPGDPVAVALVLEDEPLVATALVADAGSPTRPARLAFELIATADQDRLAGFVQQVDHGRFW